MVRARADKLDIITKATQSKEHERSARRQRLHSANTFRGCVSKVRDVTADTSRQIASRLSQENECGASFLSSALLSSLKAPPSAMCATYIGGTLHLLVCQR